ncbi:endoglucanase 4 [Aplysia californica]|uniref:Endoglucanase n=1 Tax=Aplysia californica TaxID=6500 RepID=A0ABM0ZW37_APLCA|nr:endoglucanase 4 [Aplysia californica]
MMRWLLSLAVCVAATHLCLAVDVPISGHWQGGFQGKACFDIKQEMQGWKVHLKFSQPINSLEVFVANVGQKLSGGKEFVVTNKDFNKNEHVGDQLCFEFIGHGNGDIHPTATATIEGTAPSTSGGGSGGSHGGTHAPVTHPLGPGPTIGPLPKPGNHLTSATMTLGYQNGNSFEGTFSFPIKEHTMGYLANFTFNEPLSKLEIYDAAVLTHLNGGRKWIIVNKGDRAGPTPGTTLALKFRAEIQGAPNKPTGHAVLQNLGIDPWSVQPAHDGDHSKYNYNDLLYKSILFYEAQRSGKLPNNNHIPWRGDSALGDKGAKGEDLTGGWYDAGDHVKFNFPMSYSTTILTWGYLLYPDAYRAAGQESKILDCVRWPLEYLLKCHTAPEELYVQVGNGGIDHGYWGSPEAMTMSRPSYKITASNPGSDVAMETAAAMAAGYLAFKNKDAHFASNLLSHAKQLWEFGNKYRGKYSNSVTAAAGFYTSNNYTDELAWGSLWLYQATNDHKYLAEAERQFDPEPAWGMSWDEKTIGNQLLLYKLTHKEKYKTAVIDTYKSWFPGGDITYTPKGLAFRLEWASLRYASNMAMAALIAADAGINPREYRHWAMCQIHYALGDSGRSFVVGFGHNPPKSPHHRGSSCPVLPARCGSFAMRAPGPNVHTLYGALVGGPGSSDDYKDERDNYQNNEVATDYNAGFTTAIAALKHLYIKKLHPEQTGSAHCPYSAGHAVVG